MSRCPICAAVGFDFPYYPAFAVLFLVKANVAADLARRLKGKKDVPGGAELRGGRNVPDPASVEERGLLYRGFGRG